MKIDCISDLHGHFPPLEGGDLLIIAGDHTGRDTIGEWQNFGFWLHSQPYKHKVWIAGNHDDTISRNRAFAKEFACGAHYLEDEALEIEGFKLWGTPWTHRFPGINPDCAAFTLKQKTQLMEKWALIPDDTDILITHMPPFGILDGDGYYQRYGCDHLRERVHNIKPKLHVFGHIHEGYGQISQDGTHFINAAHMTMSYYPANQPIRVTL